jgi:hypothetical protein
MSHHVSSVSSNLFRSSFPGSIRKRPTWPKKARRWSSVLAMFWRIVADKHRKFEVAPRSTEPTVADCTWLYRINILQVRKYHHQTSVIWYIYSSVFMCIQKFVDECHGRAEFNRNSPWPSDSTYHERLMQHNQARAKKWLNAVQEVASLRPTLSGHSAHGSLEKNDIYIYKTTLNIFKYSSTDAEWHRKAQMSAQSEARLRVSFLPHWRSTLLVWKWSWRQAAEICWGLLRSAEICWDN